MKLQWRVLKNIFMIASGIVTYGSVSAWLMDIQPKGLSWPWYILIGVTILILTLSITIKQLHSENNYFKGEEHQLHMRQKQLEVEEKEIKKAEREGLASDIQLSVFSKPNKVLKDTNEKTNSGISL